MYLIEKPIWVIVYLYKIMLFFLNSHIFKNSSLEQTYVPVIIYLKVTVNGLSINGCFKSNIFL